VVENYLKAGLDDIMLSFTEFEGESMFQYADHYRFHTTLELLKTVFEHDRYAEDYRHFALENIRVSIYVAIPSL
jgi:hypothetical protein